MVQHNPLISFVIPCYNQGRYLPEAIASALAQRDASVEVIVVNDGSTDNTHETMERHPSIKTLHQENLGLAAARNAGARLASGEYLCWLDADDRVEPDFARALIDRSREQGCDFAFCDFKSIDESGDLSYVRAYAFDWPLAHNITDLLIRGGFFPPVCAIGRRVAFPEFPPGMDGHADYAVWLDVSLQGKKFCHVPRALACYREYSGGMSRDRQHMELSAQAALACNARKHPQAFFEAIQGLQRTCLAMEQLSLQRFSPRQRVFQTLHIPPVRTMFRNWRKRRATTEPAV